MQSYSDGHLMVQIVARVARYAHFALGAYWLLLFVATHIPRPDVIFVPNVSDKLIHFGAYAALAFLAMLAVTARGIRHPAAYLAVLVGLSAYGAVDELLQYPIPGRYAEFYDWVADSVGAAIGLAAFAIALRIRHLLFRPAAAIPTGS